MQAAKQRPLFDSYQPAVEILGRECTNDAEYPDLWDMLYNKETSGKAAGEYTDCLNQNLVSPPLFYKKKGSVSMPKILQEQLATSMCLPSTHPDWA